jgi:hypothetical protein
MVRGVGSGEDSEGDGCPTRGLVLRGTADLEIKGKPPAQASFRLRYAARISPPLCAGNMKNPAALFARPMSRQNEPSD